MWPQSSAVAGGVQRSDPGGEYGGDESPPALLLSFGLNPGDRRKLFEHPESELESWSWFRSRKLSKSLKSAPGT